MASTAPQIVHGPNLTGGHRMIALLHDFAQDVGCDSPRAAEWECLDELPEYWGGAGKSSPPEQCGWI